jgi:hypothetical protein
MGSNAKTRTMTVTYLADWHPKSQATTPAAFPPHPPLQSGGWYHGSAAEAPGPGRPPVVVPAKKSLGLAVLFTVLFGPLGLCYLSVNYGLVATVLAVGILGYAGMGFLPVLFIWPMTVAVAAWLTARR